MRNKISSYHLKTLQRSFNKTRFLFLTLFCLYLGQTTAQNDFNNAKKITSPSWTIKTGLNAAQDAATWDGKQDTDIEWLKVTPSGRLIIASSQGLLAYNPENGKSILDTRTLSGVLSGFDANTYREVPNSPFFTIRYSKIVGRTDHFIAINYSFHKMSSTKAQLFQLYRSITSLI